MARPLRLEYEGAIYHVMARGNLKQAIFRDAHDRLRFLDKLEEAITVHHLRMYAWTLMTSHYHLLLCTPRANLSRAMQQLQSSYSTYFRVRHGLHGHVFGGRYKAPLVDGDRYLLALTRYIHLNPVRVPSVKSRPITEQMWYLRRHPWSSYRDYIGRRHRYAWVSHGPLLDLVSGGRAGKPAAYRKFVEAGIGAPDEELNAAMRLSSKAVGSTEFCAWAEREYQKIKNGQPRPEDVAMRRQEVVVPPEAVQRAVAKRCRIKTQELLLSRGNTFARDVLMTAWRDLSDLSNREIGHRLGHADGATVGKRFSDLKRDGQQKCRAQAVVKRMGKRLIANCKA